MNWDFLNLIPVGLGFSKRCLVAFYTKLDFLAKMVPLENYKPVGCIGIEFRKSQTAIS